MWIASPHTLTFPTISIKIYLAHVKYFGGTEICSKTHDNIHIALVGQTIANI